MRHVLFLFYIIFFATGFMGTAALIVLRFRIESRLINPLLLFQVIFLTALGMTLIFFYLQNLSAVSSGFSPLLMSLILALNAALYAVVFIVIRRLVSLSPGVNPLNRVLYTAALVSVSLSVLKNFANLGIVIFSSAGISFTSVIAEANVWSLAGYILNTVSMLLFGISVIYSFPLSGEPKIIGSLLKGYAICTLVFAPLGLTEYLIETLKLPGLPMLSLDHFYYLAWNIISMSAAVRLFRPADHADSSDEAVPEERVRALGLSGREKEAAVLISRGMSNKEIAAELGISPATVRTHIYNLYRKAGARSRVELLNKLKK